MIEWRPLGIAEQTLFDMERTLVELAMKQWATIGCLNEDHRFTGQQAEISGDRWDDARRSHHASLGAAA
jgi:hypothetical protein